MAFPNKVRIGSPFTGFPAASFNALVDGHNSQLAQRQPTPARPAAGPFAQCPRLVVRVLNSLSSDIGPGEILGFSEPAISLAGDESQVYGYPAVKGITPAVPEHSNQFVVALDGIRGTTSTGTTGAIGPAVLMGLAWCKVNWTDNAHDKVEVAEGETKLQSSDTGITPIYHGTIPGELPADVWALVLLGGGGGSSNLSAAMMVLTEDIDAATGDTDEITPASASAQRYETDPDTKVRTPTGDPVTVYNYDTCQGADARTLIYVAASDDVNEIIAFGCCQIDEPA